MIYLNVLFYNKLDVVFTFQNMPLWLFVDSINFQIWEIGNNKPFSINPAIARVKNLEKTSIFEVWNLTTGYQTGRILFSDKETPDIDFTYEAAVQYDVSVVKVLFQEMVIYKWSQTHFDVSV